MGPPKAHLSNRCIIHSYICRCIATSAASTTQHTNKMNIHSRSSNVNIGWIDCRNRRSSRPSYYWPQCAVHKLINIQTDLFTLAMSDQTLCASEICPHTEVVAHFGPANQPFVQSSSCVPVRDEDSERKRNRGTMRMNLQNDNCTLKALEQYEVHMKNV